MINNDNNDDDNDGDDNDDYSHDDDCLGWRRWWVQAKGVDYWNEGDEIMVQFIEYKSVIQVTIGSRWRPLTMLVFLTSW